MKPPVEAHATQPVVLPRPALPPLALKVLSDERLARLVAGGDRNAFGVVFDRHHRELYRYCLSLLRDPDDAADALQSTMLRALAALEGETRKIALRPWLFKIAHNEAMTLMRRRPAAEDAGDLHAGRGWDVEASFETRARIGQLLEDVRDLPERQRGALMMRELAGLEYSEIAAALETTPAAAKQAIYEARQALFQLERGRGMECDGVRLTLSNGDRRAARGRAVRSHLRACSECRDFEEITTARRKTLAGLTPVLPAGSLTLLRALFGGGGSAGAAASGVVSGVAGPFAVKAASGIAMALAIGVGATQVAVTPDRPAVASTDVPQAPAPATASTESSGDRSRDARTRGSSGQGERSRRPTQRSTRSGGRAGRTRTNAGAAEGSGGRAPYAATTSTPQASTTHQQGASQPPPAAQAPPRGSAQPSGPLPAQVAEPVRTVTGTVESTVGQVRDAVPVRTPPVPQLPKRRG